MLDVTGCADVVQEIANVSSGVDTLQARVSREVRCWGPAGVDEYNGYVKVAPQSRRKARKL